MSSLGQGRSRKQLPGPSSTDSHPTSSRLARITAMALSLMLTLLLLTPTKTEAHGYFFGGSTPITYTNSNVEYCFLGTWPFSTSTAKNTMIAAIENWDTYANNRTFTQVTGSWCTIEIRWTSFAAKGWPDTTDARTTVNEAWNGAKYVLADADMWLNSDHIGDIWSYGASQNCYVVCNYASDLWTITQHEFGHTIGIGHNTTTNTSYCGHGQLVDRPDLACSGISDWYTVDIMYVHAGDGYRRYIEADSLGALVAMDYRN